MAEFERTPLGLVLGERGYIRGPFGSALVRSELSDHGVPVYEQQHAITDTREFRFFVDEEKFKELSRFQVRPNDLIISCSGTVGRISIIQPDDPMGIISQALLILRPRADLILPTFLYYFFSTPEGQHALVQASHGSVQVNIAPRAVVEQIEVPTPEISEQHAIAHVLGTLDDKIELNRRMSETLDSIAQALFKSWFVDFDPVRAKAEGRDPGLPKPLADLFPSSLVESEVGDIPKGWEVRGLAELARFLNGLALQKYPPKDGPSLPVIKIAQLRAGSADGADRATADLDADYIVEDGDVLFSWSGSLECVLWAGGQGALNQHLFKVTSAKYPKWLYYLWIRQHLQDFRHIAAAKATTMGHIQRHHLAGAKVILPPATLIQTADRHIGPLIEAIPSHLVQSRTLAATRDALLPKLVSGELRLEDFSRTIGQIS
jgi:type I restriction enzyme S subunit